MLHVLSILVFVVRMDDGESGCGCCREGVTLKEFLDGFRHEAALLMHWVVVGPSHRGTRPATGGVLRAYRSCRLFPSPVVKSITNTFKLANICGSPHTFEHRSAACLPVRYVTARADTPVGTCYNVLCYAAQFMHSPCMCCICCVCIHLLRAVMGNIVPHPLCRRTKRCRTSVFAAVHALPTHITRRHNN